jgi:VWFA-related protein
MLSNEDMSRTPTIQLWLSKVAGCLASVICLIFLSPVASSQTNKKPKLKNFGSSLDRLKWDKEKQAAVEKSSPRKASGDDEDVIRVDAQLIAADILVQDRRGQPVKNLTKDDFIISEDGEPQQIGHFSLGGDQTVPKSIVLIIDYSGSEIPYIEKSTFAAKRLVDYLGPEDRMAIVTDDVKLVLNFTNDKKKLKHTLDDLLLYVRLGFHGKSQQFSALMATARELIDNEDIRPIIVFQTDGDQRKFLQPPNKFHKNLQPMASPGGVLPSRIQPFSLDDVVLALDKVRVTVYTVIPNVRLIGLSEEELPQQTKELMKKAGRVYGFSANYPKKDLLHYAREYYLPDQEAAAKVATATGGWTAFLELPEQADEIYSRIMSDVDSRYVLGYYYPPGRVRDGKRHSLSITVKNHPEYQIVGRKSYVAPLSNP